MRRRLPPSCSLLLFALATACSDRTPTAPTARAIRASLDVSAEAAADPVSFCNPATITIPRLSLQPGPGPASPYPSPVVVSGMGSGSFKVTASAHGISHGATIDIDVLLVGPTGVTVMLMSDVTGGRLSNATLTFDDDASSFVPSGTGVIPSGSYKPTNLTRQGHPAIDPMPGAPAGPHGSLLSGFAGTNLNGTWSLYVFDDLSFFNGSIAGGWCVTFTSTNAAPIANAGGPYEGHEGSAISFDGSESSDPNDEPIASYAWTFGDGATGDGPNPQHAYADDGTYTVRLLVTDDDGASSEATTTVTVTNVAPTVTALTLPLEPVAVGAPLTIGASFTDPGTADLHTATFDLDNGTTAAGTVVESSGSGSATASVSYAAPGVYTIDATVTDDDGGSGSRSSAADVPGYVVVYDPTGGFVTGGGWISSPAGAYTAEPTFTGKATFGFVAKYRPGANKPSGNTEFQFKAVGLTFKSTSYEWLVVAGAHAKYKGEGAINGVGGYGFMLTAVDGQLLGGSSSDAFRIKIWELASGAIVYDNEMGEGDDSEAANSLGGGSIVIHK